MLTCRRFQQVFASTAVLGPPDLGQVGPLGTNVTLDFAVVKSIQRFIGPIYERV